MKMLTNREKQVLEFIKECDLPPTGREIADTIGWRSASNGKFYRDKLIEKGYLQWVRKGCARAYAVIEDDNGEEED